MGDVLAVGSRLVNAAHPAEVPQRNKTEEISLFGRIAECLKKAFSYFEKPKTWAAITGIVAVAGLVMGSPAVSLVALPLLIPVIQLWSEQKNLEDLIARVEAASSKHELGVAAFNKNWEEIKQRVRVAPLEELLTLVKKVRVSLGEVGEESFYCRYGKELEGLVNDLQREIRELNTEPSSSAIREQYRSEYQTTFQKLVAAILQSMSSHSLSLKTSRAMYLEELKRYG